MEQTGDIPPGVKVPETPLATVPTTEELLDLEKEIQRLVEKKRKTDLHIIDLEARIYAVETEYFKETSAFGSLLNGLEGYLGAGGPAATPRRHGPRDIKDSDRLFSNTSSSYQRALAVHNRLVRERSLDPINVTPGSKKSSGGSSSATGVKQNSNLSSSLNRRKRPADPAWGTPSRSR